MADANNSTIRKVTPAGVVTTLAGLPGSSGSADGTGRDARFDGPSGVAVDGTGNVYVTDTGNYTIRKVTPAGVVTTLAGLAGISGSADGTGGAARFNWPGGVAVDGAGNVFVADSDNNTIRKGTLAPSLRFNNVEALADGSVRLNFTGGVGLGYTIYGSTNLVNWVPLQSFVCTNETMAFEDPAAMNFKCRFYQAVMTP